MQVKPIKQVDVFVLVLGLINAIAQTNIQLLRGFIDKY